MIAVSDLGFSYRGANTPALSGLDFEVAEQEIFGLLGPSGAGKSTTQNVLIGMLKQYTGSATVLGRQLRDAGSDYYEEIGVCFELPNHYLRLTARENLDYFRSLYSRDTHTPDEVLEWVGLAEDSDRRVGEFSKGMKTRLNLARSLIHRPRVLFLDEPTGGLDPVTARSVKQLILDLRERGTTVLLTTHDMTIADQLCDRLAFITSGRIAAIDSPEALKRKHGSRSLRVTYLDNERTEQTREFSLEGLGQNQDFIDLLRSAPRVETIHSQETTLEQVFIEVTGEELTA